MKQLTCVLVSQDGLIHEMVGGVVRKVTKSRWAHVAVKMDICGVPTIVEMVQPQIQLTDYNKYFNEEVMLEQSFPVSDEFYDIIQKTVTRLVQKKQKYGLLTDCVCALVADLLGQDIGNKYALWVEQHFDTMDCSELWTRLIRLPYPMYLEYEVASTVSPEDVYRGNLSLLEQLKNLGGEYSGN